jgi:hypothetical protein
LVTSSPKERAKEPLYLGVYLGAGLAGLVMGWSLADQSSGNSPAFASIVQKYQAQAH